MMQRREPTRQDQINRRVLLGTLSNYMGQFAAFAAWFILTPFILDEVGVAMYGLWTLLGSIVAYGSLLDFGVWGAIIKYVAEFRALNKEAEINALVGTALVIYLALGSLIVVGSLMVAPAVPRLFALAPELQQTAIVLFAVMGAVVGVSIPAMAPLAVLRGLQRYDLVNIANLAGTAVEFVGIVTVLQMGGGILGLVVVQLVGVFAMQLSSLFILKRVAPQISFNPFRARRDFVGMVFRYSTPLFGMEIAGRLQTRSDEITIGVFMPVSAIAPYALMRKLSQVTHILTRQFMKVLFPLASELNAEQDTARLRALYLTGTRLTLAIFLPLACLLTLLSGPILHFWVGDEYLPYVPVMVLLTVASLAATSQWPAVAILQGTARHRILGFTALGSGAANLLLSVLLIHPFGLVGVAWGTVVPTMIENWGVILPFILREMRVSLVSLFERAILPAGLPLIPLALSVYIVQTYGDPYLFTHLIAAMLLGGASYVAFYLSLNATRSEREFIGRGLRQFLL